MRASGLYACLRRSGMYGFHRMRHDALYTDYVVYSPDVPVFRGEDGRLLEEPYLASFLTSPAPNVRAMSPSRRGELPAALRGRILKVLAVGEAHGHDRLVLGAWGCGAFGNDPSLVAGLFEEALSGPFRGTFQEVVFAVRDETPDRRVLQAFRERFGA